MRERIKQLIGLILALNVLFVSAKAIDVRMFSDCSKINPVYREAISFVSDLGILEGYSNGTYQPNDRLSRGAAAKIIASMKLGTTAATNLEATKAPFKDVKSTHIFSGYIEYCSRQGFINGYADGLFRPGSPLTGYAFAKMLLNATDAATQGEKYTGKDWEVFVYQDAIQAGIFTNSMQFDPKEMLTREETAWLTYNALTQKDTADTTEAQRIQSLPELEKYLNQHMSSCITPIGTYTYSYTVRERTSDFIIETAHMGSFPWYTLQYSDSITASTKEKTLEILRDFQKNIYAIASSAFPDQAIAGGFCDTG